MRQLIQNLKNGKLNLKEVSYPLCKDEGVIVKNIVSLVSIGTEKSIIELASKSLVGKAKARPDLFKRAWEKARKEGFLKVFKESMSRLDEPFPLGYSASGEVVEIGKNVKSLSAGERVAIAGSGYANHSEYNYVPEDMCFKLPEKNGKKLGFEEAAFCMVGGIVVHGINEAELKEESCVAVVGLGLLGLLAIQILKAQGHRVIGIDVNKQKVQKAEELGCEYLMDSSVENAEDRVSALTGFKGVSSVLITAASKDNSPVDLAQRIAGQKGRIILVGMSDIHLDRKYFWDKELTFKVSKAAGAGDLERKNIEYFLNLLAEGKVDVKSLITHRFFFNKAVSAYKDLLKGKESFIGVLFDYANKENDVAGKSMAVDQNLSHKVSKDRNKNIGLIGGGQFARNILLPSLEEIADVNKIGIATTQGMTSGHIAGKFGFEYSTTDYQRILKDEKIGSVFILTRHNLHTKLIVEALQSRKNVLVEKPLCLNKKELKEIVSVFNHEQVAMSQEPKIMVGFNRRYSPHAKDIKSFFDKGEPFVINYRINAGFIESSHWTQNKGEGGGRIVGEVCHFVDLLQFITSSYPIEVYTQGVTNSYGYGVDDNIITVLKFKNGSVATITYSAKGNKSYPREIIEIYQSDSIYYLEDFRKAVKIKSGKKKKFNFSSQEMGYREEIEYFFSYKKPNFQDYLFNSLAVFAIQESLDNNKIVYINPQSLNNS